MSAGDAACAPLDGHTHEVEGTGGGEPGAGDERRCGGERGLGGNCADGRRGLGGGGGIDGGGGGDCGGGGNGGVGGLGCAGIVSTCLRMLFVSLSNTSHMRSSLSMPSAITEPELNLMSGVCVATSVASSLSL